MSDLSVERFFIERSKQQMDDPYEAGRQAALRRQAKRDGAKTRHLYVSTCCQHELHADCRLICKHCEAPCLCPCHTEGDGK